MKKILFALMLLCSSAFSQTVYNIVQTSYIQTTIAQTVVFNATMKAGGTFTFSVEANNGGGNANTNDTANVKILFYNNGTLLHTANTNYSGNLPIPTGYHGVNPAVPWTTLTISSTNCGSSCANVTHAVVQMVGIDGSYWAGDYGPHYRLPSFTFNSGSNILYNPEFGTAPNGTLVQGWTSTAGWGTCQGAYGGSNSCSTNTSGIVANQSNGGYSATGGTTSAEPGGYTAAPATPTPSWQAIRTNSNPVVISNIYPTSYNSPGGEGAANAFDGNTGTKYLNFDKKNAGVTVRLSQGRVVQKFTITTANDFSGRDPTSYKLYGSNDGVNWTLIKTDSLSLSETRFWTSPEILVANTTAYVYYFMLFPTTKAGEGCGLDCNSMQIAEITYYYDANDGVTSTDQAVGSTPANPGQPGSVCGDCFSSEITATQQSLLDAARARRNAISVGNRIDIYSDGSGNSISIEQVGSYNKIHGLGGAGTNAHVAGFGNSVDIKQGDTLSGRNLIELYVQGNGNNLTMSQARNTTTGAVDGSESGGHIARVSISGDVGTYIFRQGNDGGSTSGHFLNYTMSGSGGTHRVTQSNNGEKLAFISVTGNSNNDTVVQSGTGSHFLDLTLTGNNNNANITQSGSGSHKATISLINAGGASNATLIQQGSTNQIYSITQQCANLSGCSVSVTQGTGP